MAIRLSGLSSNLDTDSIVKSLVSAYSLQKTKLVKAQTKLQWSQDSWKDMNSKIYSLYTNQFGTMRLSPTYSKKTASITNATSAKVSASNSAVNGTQTLKVNKLASSGYLTGGEVGATVVETTKLSSMAGMPDLSSGASFTVRVGDTTKNINVTDTTTVSQFVVKLKDAGVNASFDEKNHRFFINAKESGADNDFALAASSSNATTALSAMGLLSGAPTAAELAANPDAGSTEYKEYVKWAGYGSSSAWSTFTANGYTASDTDSDDVKELKTYFDAQYSARKTTVDAQKTSITKSYTNAKDVMKNYNMNVDTLTTLNARKDVLDAKVADGSITESEQTELTAVNTNISKVNEAQASFTEEIRNNATDTINTYENYFQEDSAKPGTYVVKEDQVAAFTAVAQSKADALNNTLKTNIGTEMSNKISAASDALSQMAAVPNAATKVNGADSEIILNGATYKNNTNNYSINGLTIQALSIDTVGTSITTDTDVDGIYNVIKDFLKNYNTTITAMDTAYNAASAKSYEPLTDDEKDAMTDTEVEKWETKIKTALLRRDPTLENVSSTLKSSMAKGYEVDGKTYSLSSFGINTLSYFKATANTRGEYHIDGDSTDSYTSGNKDKLKEAIANNPDAVVGFFTQLAGDTYTTLGKQMSSTTLRSAYTVYNDKQMNKEYSEYTTKIKDWETKISTYENYYYSKFSAMETALSKLNSNQSSLSNLLG